MCGKLQGIQHEARTVQHRCQPADVDRIQATDEANELNSISPPIIPQISPHESQLRRNVESERNRTKKSEIDQVFPAKCLECSVTGSQPCTADDGNGQRYQDAQDGHMIARVVASIDWNRHKILG